MPEPPARFMIVEPMRSSRLNTASASSESSMLPPMCTGSGPIAHMPTIAAAVAVALCTSPLTPWEFSP